MTPTPLTTTNRRIRPLWLRAAVMALLWSFTHAAAANDRAFSAPTTEPEKALHAILQWAMAETELHHWGLGEFLRQLPGRNTHRDREFRSKFTDALVQSISAADQARRTADCDGLCGLDFMPIFCAQDVLYPLHFYLTTNKELGNGWPASVAATANHTYVRYRSGKASDPYAHHIDYLMEKQIGRWKIAGIYCVPDRGFGGSKFNIP